MPAWLLWLSGVILAVPVATAWLAFAGRTRHVEVSDTVAEYERFRAALAKPVHPPRD
jgi:hypothetical protein